MSILSELNTLIESIGLSVETGVFSGTPPNEYVVLTPLTDSFSVFANNKPQIDVSEVRLSLFSKNNYLNRKNQLVRLLLQADFVITERRYVGYENDTGYHNFCIDCCKCYAITPEYELKTNYKKSIRKR